MRVTPAFANRSRLFGALVVLLALLLRFAVPAGYMLASDGSLAIVPCPSGGLLPGMDTDDAMADPAMPMRMSMPGMAMPEGHHHHHHQPDGLGTQDCPYGALAAPVLPGAPPLLIHAQPLDYAELRIPAQHPSIVRSLAAPPPPATGPPGFA